MNKIKKTIALGAGAMMALSGTAGVALAAGNAEAALDAPDVQEAREVGVSQQQKLDKVEGLFFFDQCTVASNQQLQKNIQAASKYLCGGQEVSTENTASMDDWEITVGGAVENGFTATLEEVRQSADVKTTIMGCSCAGNGVDGISSENAEVTGVPVTQLLARAGILEGANTVVFSSADGYEVALPLDYLAMHYCPLVFAVNGSPLAESVGGINQLWLGSTAASYFAHDIVSITVEERQTPPLDPTSPEARASFENLPNIGVRFGGDVA